MKNFFEFYLFPLVFGYNRSRSLKYSLDFKNSVYPTVPNGTAIRKDGLHELSKNLCQWADYRACRDTPPARSEIWRQNTFIKPRKHLRALPNRWAYTMRMTYRHWLMKYVTEREKNEDTCRYQHSDFRRAYLLHLILKNIAPLQRTTPLQVHYFPYHTNRTL